MEKSTVVAITGASLGVIGLTCLGYSMSQIHSMRTILLGSAKRINELSHVDIDQEMVNNMVKRSVKDQASTVAEKAATVVAKSCTNDMTNRIKSLLGNKKMDIEKMLSDEVLKQISETDKHEIVEKVTAKASEMLAERLSNDLDSNVGRMGKIYSGLMAMMG